MTTRMKLLIGILTFVFVGGIGLVMEIDTNVDERRLVLVASMILWLVALVSLLSRRDVEIHDKLSWVVAVLLLNGPGAVLYFFFGPERQPGSGQSSPVDSDAIAIHPEAESWNTFLGTNRLGSGNSLNPKNTEGESSGDNSKN